MQACPCPWLLSAPNRHVLFSLSDAGQRQILAFLLDTRLLWALDLNRPFCLGHQGTSLWSRPFPTTSTQPPGSPRLLQLLRKLAFLSSYALAYLAALLQLWVQFIRKYHFCTSPVFYSAARRGRGRVGCWGCRLWTRVPVALVPSHGALGKSLPCLELRFPHL